MQVLYLQNFYLINVLGLLEVKEIPEYMKSKRTSNYFETFKINLQK